MPELPEVETVKNTLLTHLKNRHIISSEVIYKKMIHTPLDEFDDATKNTDILDIKRKGKYLLFFFSNGKVLLSHLRMEGKYLYFKETDENPIHTRVIFHLDNDEKVIYDDSRCFGVMEVYKKEDVYSCPSLSKLGPEPFDCDGYYLQNALKNKTLEIKSAILDQTILSGLGNIYADETLFACHINPYAKANSLSLEDYENIIINSRRILSEAIIQGGSTVSSYHPENGVDGRFQNRLQVYGKKDSSCPFCGKTLRKDFCNGRGTTYCPSCQHVAKRIGIYGKIAAGKSTVLDYYLSLGYSIFSCDEFINSLYKSSIPFKTKLIELFSEAVLNDDGQISKPYIKNAIVNDSSLKKKLEAIIHPMVKAGIHKFVLEHKKDEIVFIEVPLMFETKCNTLMDEIIGIDASQESQINHLILRGSKYPLKDLQLNSTNKFDKYVTKCDYVIHNNGSREELFDQCNNVLLLIKSK